MKLPNFYDFEPLNRVKARMGIPRDRVGTLYVEIKPPRLPDVLEQLAKEGKDVRPGEIEFRSDGTIAFGQYRVLVYIRDRKENYSLPKFHFASCSTLDSMMADKKIDKYVVATRMDGLFELNIIEGGISRRTKEKLDVCKNCLQKLTYKGYSHAGINAGKKQKIVSEFSISTFFSEYPVSLLTEVPKFNSDNGPINTYTNDWEKLSREYRESVHWRCENPKCGRVLAQSELRQYLHTHHRNGNKYDNKTGNLMALCVKCHAEQPDHAHMKKSPQYTKFTALNL